MKFLLRILCFLVAVLGVGSAHAQYYTWGSDPAGLKWSTLKMPDVRIIYPDTVRGGALRTFYYIRAVQPHISHGFRHGPMRIPFILHPENFQANGLVMYLPKRVEFLTIPSVDNYSMPWLKQLVAHEYRHAVQYNNLNRGVIRVLSYVFGQQGSTVGLLCMPMWAMEGDAVMTETQMSSFGRGLQPSFTMGYRAMGNIAHLRKNTDKWFCGSYRDYVPDHYELGYQICSYAYEKYGENVWDKVAWYGSRNPYLLATTRVALGKFYKTNVSKLFRETFDDLNRYWDSLPEVKESTTPITPLDKKNYTTYQWPLMLNDSTVLALKSDFDTPSRWVKVDMRTGLEQRIAYTGMLSSRPSLHDGRLWWTEFRRSKLFEQRVNSQLCYMDLNEGRPRQENRQRRVLYATPNDRGLGWIDYDPRGVYSLKFRDDEGVRTVFSLPLYTEIHGLAWDKTTSAWYVLVTDDSGMWPARIDEEGLHALTPGRYITLSDLSAAGGRLYYGSIASGKDEAHCYDLLSRREYRISRSQYGSFSPSPSPSGDEVVLTSYSSRGYALARQSMSDEAVEEITPDRVPVNLVNPHRRSWNLPNLDSVHFSMPDSMSQEIKHHSKHYRKAPNLLNIHSWMPLGFDPFAAVDEHIVDVNLGFTFISQNLLSNTEAFASYGWNKGEGSLFNLGVRYFGLGVHFDLDASYGGNQVFYSLGQYNEETGKYEYQKRPSPDKYYHVGLTASLPLFYQRGYHNRQLGVAVGWNYSNGMVARLNNIEWADHKISNLEHIGFSEGLHKVSLGVSYSDNVRMAHRDFLPRWGYGFNLNYAFNPSNDNFSDLVSVYAQGFLPGFARHNSLKLAFTYQTSVGGYKFPSGYAPLTYRSTRLIPHGYSSADILSNHYTACSADYQFPLCYPEGGIHSVLFIKRIRMNVGGQYAQFRDVGRHGWDWRRIWAVGGDIIFDVNVFRQPASATSTVKFSLYRPSNGGVWFTAAVGLPF